MLIDQVQQRIPYSSIYLALFVQNPNIDVIQPIYVRDNPAKGAIQQIALTSLREFLKNTPLTESQKWYDVVTVMEIPNKGQIPIHFWLPRDEDLHLSLLDQNLNPFWHPCGILTVNIFNSPNEMRSFKKIQSALNSAPKMSPALLSSTLPFSFIESTTSGQSSSSSALVSRSSSSDWTQSTTLVDPTSLCSSSSSSSSSSEMIQSIYKKNRSDFDEYFALFVQNPNIDEEQTIYARSSLLVGSLHEIAKASLKNFLENTPYTLSEKAYECVKVEDGSLTHFKLPRDQRLKLGLLDTELQPIYNIFGQIVNVRIFSNFGTMVGLDIIKASLERSAKRLVVAETSASFPVASRGRRRACRSPSVNII